MTRNRPDYLRWRYGGSDDFDVFMSLGGCDRPAVTRLVRAMRERGLRVFLDTDRIAHFRASPRRSRPRSTRPSTGGLLLGGLPVPSRVPGGTDGRVPGRATGGRPGPPDHRGQPRAGHRPHHARGTVRRPVRGRTGRNPRHRGPGRPDPRPGARHRRADRRRALLRPAALVSRPGARRRRIRRPLPRTVGAAHRALRRGPRAHPGVRARPAAVVAGLPGSGRSALVAAYAWQFGAAFRGGVHGSPW